MANFPGFSLTRLHEATVEADAAVSADRFEVGELVGSSEGAVSAGPAETADATCGIPRHEGLVCSKGLVEAPLFAKGVQLRLNFCICHACSGHVQSS